MGRKWELEQKLVIIQARGSDKCQKSIIHSICQWLFIKEKKEEGKEQKLWKLE